MVSGTPPIRARKLRYFDDGNFTERRLAAPVLESDRFADVPPPRADDWQRQTRPTHPALLRQWSELVTSSEEVGPRPDRALAKPKPQPDRHLDLPLFQERAPEPDAATPEADGTDLDGDDNVIEFPGGVRM